jgi:hypothetical protein
MSQNEVFVNLPVKPHVKEAVTKLREDLEKRGVNVRSFSDAVAIAVTAYDILYNSQFGDKLTAAVKKSLEAQP